MGVSRINASSQFSKVNPYLMTNDCLSISINIENDIFDIWVIIHVSVTRFDSSVDFDRGKEWTYFGIDASFLKPILWNEVSQKLMYMWMKIFIMK